MANDQLRTTPETVKRSGDIRNTAAFALASLAGGHGVFHWYTQSFYVVLPSIKTALGLSPVQIGFLITIRNLVSGLVSLPAGILLDIFRRQWGLMLAGCLGCIAAAYVVLSLAPNYPLVAASMVLVALPPALWHLLAMTSLSRRFTERRGMALALHGVGGNVGDVVGPVVTGFLLAALVWQQVFRIYAMPVLLLSVVAIWAFRTLETGSGDEPGRGRGQVGKALGLLKSRTLLLVIGAMGLRGMAQTAFFAFFTIYLAEELDMSGPQVGFHLGLLTFMGIFSAPVLGFLSDRLGRKVVLVPALFFLGLMTVLLVTVATGWGVTIVVAVMGLFMYSIQATFLAGALDTVQKGVEATALGLVSFVRHWLDGASPIIAGAIYGALGSQETFYYVATLFFAAAVLVALLPFPVTSGKAG
ncbi:MAG: MFS transporter [Dehalococcoidia bacterium]|nr:MFS transporter [Dehalococcoidia bacterium]